VKDRQFWECQGKGGRLKRLPEESLKEEGAELEK